MRNLWIMALIGAGCGDKDTDTEGTDTGSEDSADLFAELVYVTEAPVGDFTGFEDGYTDTWLSQEVDAKKQVTVSMTGEVEDFETGNSVEEATVELFYSNAIAGTADQSVDSNSEGDVSGEWPVCLPVAYRVSTDPDIGDTKVTLQFSEIAGYADDASVQFNSVSSATYQVIPSLLGVSPDPAKGVIAGTAYDIGGTAFSGAQVIVRGSDGSIPDGIVAKYFRNDFPNRDQEWTSEDGLWVIINVPVGDWDVEMYTADGSGGHSLMGITQVAVAADSINISSVYVGYGDGVAYPSSCLVGSDTE
jgi:hypothetical protein